MATLNTMLIEASVENVVYGYDTFGNRYTFLKSFPVEEQELYIKAISTFGVKIDFGISDIAYHFNETLKKYTRYDSTGTKWLGFYAKNYDASTLKQFWNHFLEMRKNKDLVL